MRINKTKLITIITILLFFGINMVSSINVNSYIDTIQFVSLVSRIILDIIQSKPKINFRFTWMGDKEVFMKKGFKIHESWASVSSFSSFKKQIINDMNCSVCGN